MADAKKSSKPVAAVAKKAGAQSYRYASNYKIENGKIVSRNPTSPKMGAGYFMAVHKDRTHCGSSGYMEKVASKKQ